MNKLIKACVFLLLFAINASAQTATLNIKLAGSTATNFSYYIHNPPIDPKSFSGKYTVAPENASRTAVLVFNGAAPQRVSMYFDQGKNTDKSFNYDFFVSPGDDINFNVDFSKADNGIVVTGKGANNNQPLLAKLGGSPDRDNFKADTLPTRVVAAIVKQQRFNETLLAEYIAKYKPTPAFIKVYTYNNAYFAAEAYSSFKGNHKYGLKEEVLKRVGPAWEKVQDSLFRAANTKPQANKNLSPLNNDDALASSTYKFLLSNFLLREKERLWTLAGNEPDAFFKEWYNSDKATSEKIFSDDPQNLFKERIVNHYFSGKTAEYLYAVILEGAKEEQDPANVPQIFARFKKQYPKSVYLATYQPMVDAIVRRENQPLNEKMVFAKDNGALLKNLDEVLALTKGKTVLVDMWGTWCGPCREEIEANSAKIKEHFKGKGLDYLYVANYDSSNQQKWKKLIAYFNLEGTHILANDKLNQDIMTKVKGEGYPTYFIIKKDGTFELSKAGYPMDRDKLIKQLETAMGM